MSKKYLSFDEAAHIVRAAGIKSVLEYREFIKSVPGFHSQPKTLYSEWVNWVHFFTGVDSVSKLSYQEAKALVIKLGISSGEAYYRVVHEHPNLPRRPIKFYDGEWEGWFVFTGRANREDLYSFEECKKIIKKHVIRTRDEYLLLCKSDKRLSIGPQYLYQEWQGWPAFLGVPARSDKYTFEEARRVVKKLGITSVGMYMKDGMYRLDPKLPSTPYSFYKSQWKGWAHYVGLDNKAAEQFEQDDQKPQRDYAPYRAAVAIVRSAGVTSQKAYYALCKKHPSLPRNPRGIYSEWESWSQFLFGIPGNGKLTFDAARALIRLLGVSNMKAYSAILQEHPELPKYPDKFYRKAWVSMDHFFGLPEKSTLYSYEEASALVQSNEIKSSTEYESLRQNDALLPKWPNSFYKEHWKGWQVFLHGQKKLPYYSYDEAKTAVRKLGIQNSTEYMKLMRYKEDPRLPSSPYDFYRASWHSWSDFLLTA